MPIVSLPRRLSATVLAATTVALPTGLVLLHAASAASLAAASYTFEGGTLSGWVGGGGGGVTTLSVVRTPVHSGAYAVRATMPTASGGMHTGACGATTIIGGHSYTATAWLSSAKHAFRLRLAGQSDSPTATVAGGGFQKLTWTFTAAASNGKICAVTEQATMSGDTMVVDDVLVVAAASAPSPVTKVVTILAENHSLDQMRSGMPYTFGLAKTYAYATAYTAIRHPSLPNYLALSGGDTFGVTDDANPSAHVIRGQSVFGQVASSKTYAESMTSNCQLTGSGTYAVKHNPQAYFADERTHCLTSNVPAGTLTSGALHNDIANGTLPKVSLVIPNLCNDAHDCPLSTADTWISGWTKQLMAGPDYRAGRLAIVITADEDDRNSGNVVLTTVVHPSLSYKVVSSPLTHYSLLGFYEHVAGVTRLRNAATAPSFATAFGL